MYHGTAVAEALTDIGLELTVMLYFGNITDKIIEGTSRFGGKMKTRSSESSKRAESSVLLNVGACF